MFATYLLDTHGIVTVNVTTIYVSVLDNDLEAHKLYSPPWGVHLTYQQTRHKALNVYTDLQPTVYVGSKKVDNYTLWCLIHNPHCPPVILSDALQDFAGVVPGVLVNRRESSNPAS